MGKKGKRHNQGSHKKSKNRKEGQETADNNAGQDEGTKKCVHVKKAAKLGVLQNNIPHMKLRECSFCEKGQNEDAGICLCLQCGKQGCDRYSEEKHALSHYDSTPSHCLTVNIHSMMVWCYSCDMEVPVQPNTDLHECIKLLLKALKIDVPNDQIPSIPNTAHEEPMKKSEAMKFKCTSNSNRIKGLVNLGNTCFFNAVMQNLFQTELLHVAMAFVNQPDYCQTITTKSDLQALSVQVITPPGSLITALTKLLYEYRSSSPGPLNPKFLFSEICKKAPRFKGFQQQDSQELLRYLLDSVKTEQLRRVKIGILKAFEITETTEVKSLPEKKKEKLKEYVSNMAAPSVDSVFAGRLDSIVVCHECHKESRVTESFLDLSLSLAVPQSFKGRLKTPAVSQGNKKKASYHGGQGNTREDESPTKPQTPSKHQKKAAREAKRKKGRKGKKRTASHSASDDGKQETKQPEENMDATSDESDHEEHQDPAGTKEDTADQKNTGDSNTQSCAKDSGEDEVTKDKRVEDVTKATEIEGARDPGKTDVTKNSGIQNDLTMNSEIEVGVSKDSEMEVENEKDLGIPVENTKDSDPGIKTGVANNSGIKESTIEEPRDKKMAEEVSEEEPSQSNKGNLNILDSKCVTDSGIKLKGGNGGETEVSMETVTEIKLSEEQSGNFEVSKQSTDVVVVETKKVSGQIFKGVSDQHSDSDFQIMEDKFENGENCHLDDKKNVGEEDLKTEEEKHSDRLNNISSDGSASDHLRTISDGGSVNCDERETIGNDEILANATLEKGENLLHESGNSEEKKKERSDVANEMETPTKTDGNLEIDNEESHSNDHSNSNNKDGTLPAEDIARRNSCESCGKENQSCELNKNCGCLKKDAAKNKAGETTKSACKDEKEIANSLITGMKKLQITDEENNISGENTKEQVEPKNLESNAENPEMSPEIKNNAEEKVTLNEDNFLPKVQTLGSSYISSPGECSVQSCLSLFCSPEILEGKNKFACEECSKREKRGDSEQENEDDASSTEGDNKDDDGDDDDESAKGATASKPKFKNKPKRSVVYTEATKQLLLSYTPPVLTLHFKRFQQVGFGLRKVAKHVDFPLVLDLAPFCRRNGEISSDSKQQVLYSLIGVVEHSGGLNSGHYTACVKLKSSPTYGHFTDLSTIKDFACFIGRMWNKNQGASYAHAQPRDGQWYHVSDSRVSMVTEARVLKSQAYMLFYERLPLRMNSSLHN